MIIWIIGEESNAQAIQKKFITKMILEKFINNFEKKNKEKCKTWTIQNDEEERAMGD